MKGKSRIVSNGRTLRKIIGMLLAVAMVVALLPITAYATFSDMQGHWGQTAIEKWSDMEIVQGWDGAFRPNAPITRGEMAVIIDRVMKYQTKSKNSFSDLGSAFYTDAILKANAAGVIKGDGTTVRPMDNITREEAAVMLGRALGLSENPTGGTAFSDYADISGWAVGGVNAMANKGYVKGFNAAFHPKRSITRAEVVAILDNSIKQLYNGNKEYTGNVSGTAIVNTPGAVLKNMKISGDLIIAEGVGDGDITLNNVTVAGNTLLRGGGSDSIHIQGGSQISNLIIEKTDNGAIRVVTSGGAVVETVWVDDGRDDIILTGSFESITVAADVTVKAVDAKIERVEVTVKNAVLDVDKESAIDALNVTGTAANTEIKVFGKVGTLTADAKISVNNQGIIARAQINANDVSINGNAPATMNVAATVTTRPAPGSAPSSDGSSGGGGSSSPSFAGGSGTESSPYQIATAAQLDQVRNYLDKHFVLTADIDLSGYENWTPIGAFRPLSDAPEHVETPDPEAAFSGTFNGDGHTISNVRINQPEGMFVGLFGCTVGQEDNPTSIYNLTVENVDVTGFHLVGGVVGMQYSGCILENVNLISENTGDNTVCGNQGVGGITGISFEDMKNCRAEADIVVLGDDGAAAGVLAGGMEGCSTIECRVTGGTVRAEGKNCWGLGGLAGCIFKGIAATNCHVANVSITASGANTRLVGGLLGFTGTYDNDPPTQITECSADTTITVSDSTTRVGGLVGGSYDDETKWPVPSVYAIANCETHGSIT
ncbi:S-layer homology domain-containing protein, partial [Syntrophomonas wolfei]|uniref:S-layer homology domain-containing protein n=1 Tax=Syntrophomonas wolfei TaxID=863 RepID=UPI0023F1E4EA